MIFPSRDRNRTNLITPASGQTPIPPPPPPYGSSRSDYPPSPSFPLELPAPSPPTMLTGGAFGFSTRIRFGPPGSNAQSLLAGFSSGSPTGGVPVAPNLTAHTSETTQRYGFPAFTRPICNTCHVNCVNVRESNTNFCERCFQDALKRRVKKDSPTALRPECRICHVNYINVREGGMIYCERCWQEALRKRGVMEDGSV